MTVGELDERMTGREFEYWKQLTRVRNAEHKREQEKSRRQRGR